MQLPEQLKGFLDSASELRFDANYIRFFSPAEVTSTLPEIDRNLPIDGDHEKWGDWLYFGKGQTDEMFDFFLAFDPVSGLVFSIEGETVEVEEETDDEDDDDAYEYISDDADEIDEEYEEDQEDEPIVSWYTESVALGLDEFADFCSDVRKFERMRRMNDPELRTTLQTFLNKIDETDNSRFLENESDGADLYMSHFFWSDFTDFYALDTPKKPFWEKVKGFFSSSDKGFYDD